MVGKVVSDKMTNTVVVLVEGRKKHPLYKKSFLRTKRYLADDQFGVKVGDVVEIEKTRPISKKKHWKVTKVLGQDEVFLGEQILKKQSEEAIAEVMPEEPVEPVKSVESVSETPANAVEPVELEEKPKKVRKTKEKK